MLAFVLLTACTTIPGAPSGTRTETLFLDHKDKDGNAIKLEFEMYLPPGDGPFDVVLFSHGGPPANNYTQVIKPYQMASPFLKRNIAVVSIMRQGRSRSDGKVSLPGCRYDRVFPSVLEGLGDTEVGLNFIKQSPLFAGKKIYAVGYSQGGLLAGLLAARHPDIINKAITFAPGWIATGYNQSCKEFPQALQNYMLEVIANISASAQFRLEKKRAPAAPILFIHAHNDSFHPPASVIEAFDRYKAKGGTGILKMYPDYHGRFDAHDIYRDPEIWEEDVMEFLGLTK